MVNFSGKGEKFAMRCPRCGGLLISDEYHKGKLKCLMCGRWPEKALQEIFAKEALEDRVDTFEEEEEENPCL